MAAIEKYVTDSLTEKVQIIMPAHLNGAGRLFGGQLALWIDEVAGIVAIRHSGKQIVTACIDNLRFRKPVMQGEIVVMVGRVTYVGSSSMEVRVDSYVESPKGERNLINTAFLVEVAIDSKGMPAKVPRLMCRTQEEIEEFEAGLRRKKYRDEMSGELYR